MLHRMDSCSLKEKTCWYGVMFLYNKCACSWRNFIHTRNVPLCITSTISCLFPVFSVSVQAICMISVLLYPPECCFSAIHGPQNACLMLRPSNHYNKHILQSEVFPTTHTTWSLLHELKRKQFNSIFNQYISSSERYKMLFLCLACLWFSALPSWRAETTYLTLKYTTHNLTLPAYLFTKYVLWKYYISSFFSSQNHERIYTVFSKVYVSPHLPYWPFFP